MNGEFDDVGRQCWETVAMLPSKPYSVKYEDGTQYTGVLHEHVFREQEGDASRRTYSYSVGESVWIQIPGAAVRVYATVIKVKRPQNWRQLQHQAYYDDHYDYDDDYDNYGDDCPDGINRDEWNNYCESRD